MPQLCPALAKPRNWELLAKALLEGRLTIGITPADQGQVETVIKIESKIGGRMLPCSLIDKLGIEHQAIHVQDDSIDGCDCIQVLLVCHGYLAKCVPG